MRIRTTKKHKEYWKNRKIDWNQHYISTWNHPHRALIIHALKLFSWFSLWEVGCGGGPNLVRITQDLPNRQLGGSDINPDAIEAARKVFTGGRFHCEASENILLSDESVDVVLSDAHLIYYGPTKIKQVLREMLRATRNRLVLCEYNERSFWKRLWIWYKTGYYAHDYRKLLEEMGCHGIQMVKIPHKYWPDTMWSKVGYIIIAKKS